MKKLCLIRFFLVLAAFRTAVKAEDCTSNRKRLGATRGLRRYQPKTAFCARCQPLHRNLFLFGIEPKHSKLKKCFSVSQIELSHLQVQLPESSIENFIFVILNEDLVFEPEILTVLAETLGNVSILLPKNLSNNELSKQCRSLGSVCYELNNLLPVLNQMRNIEFPQEHVMRKIDFDDWNDRDLGAKFDEMSFSIHKQLDRLINELCKRDISHNKLIRILKTRRNILANEDGIVEDFKGGLSLNDLLPSDSKSYDKNRPPKLDGHPTIVYFHVTVLSLDSINEESMTYVADIFLAQSWRDSRLRLPESMSEQYRILDVEWLRDIWRPDCFFKNAKQVTFHEISIPNHYVWLYHDKTLLYMSKLTLVLSCAMKFESYPHDIQVCSMMIESLSHTVQDLMFLWNTTDPLVVNPAIELPQLDISNNYTTDCTVQYSTGNFTCVAVVFNLKRRLGYHLLHTYIPSALIVVMSWISFWIKPEAIPARVTLGVTSLLTLATQNTQSQQSLPPVSYVKAIDIWMSSCSVFVFLSLMEFAIVNNYMGPVAMKAMAGYSEEDIRSAAEDYRSRSFLPSSLVRDSRHPTCYGKEAALCIDRFSSTPVMKSRVNSWKKLNESRTKLEEIIKKAERQGCSHSELVRLLGTKSLLEKAAKNPNRAGRKPGKLLAITGIFCTFIYFTSIQTHQGFSTFWLEWIHEKKVEEQLCTITMPDEVVKIFRPPVACSICLGVTNVDKVANLFPEDFEERYAYTGRPVVVTDAMTNWTAQHVFDFDFFKKIYTKRMDRWATYNCQFFPYGTEFKHLSEVFNMSKDRALMAEGTTPWYVGWSNCDDEINEILRRHYQRPYFLPATAETKKLDWIFMGSTGFGAPMHVDNVEHPSWQAQLRGRKKWKLQPPPECFYVCQTIQIIVEPGEIIVLDTNQWYHSTTIVSKEMSITIGAEYD